MLIIIFSSPSMHLSAERTYIAIFKIFISSRELDILGTSDVGVVDRS